MARGLAKVGLSEARAQVLWELGALGPKEPPTQRQLARILKVTPRNITALIDALETTGFVHRAPHPTDRRATIVLLSEQGFQTVEHLQSGTSLLSEQLFGEISESDLKAFSMMLSQVANRIVALLEAQIVHET